VEKRFKEMMYPGASHERESSWSAQGAFSLVELMVAVAILTVLLLSAGFLFFKSAGAMDSLTRRSHTTSRALVTLDRVEEELLTANFASIVPPVPDRVTRLEFQNIIDVDDVGKPVYGNTIKIGLVPLETGGSLTSLDGRDNNRNGLVDEHGIQIWEDAPPEGASPGPEDRATLVCGNATRDGLLFTREGGILFLDFTVQEARNGDLPAVFSLRTGIRMRNDSSSD
jgi:prepilin-type N-terminal cleavage/methylation domain-containing protein